MSRWTLDRPPQAVAVFRFGAVGDVILTGSAVAALRAAWPETKIVFCTKESLAPLVVHNPHIDVCTSLGRSEGLLGYRRRLRDQGVEAILDLHGKLRSSVLSWMLPGVPRSAWRKRPWRDNLPVRLGLRPYRAHMTIGERYHHAVEALVGRELPRGELRYHVSSRDQDAADATLQAAGVSLERPIIGLSPGAKWLTKRWPVERFAELAARATQRGWQVIITGSESERPLGREITARAPGVVDLSGLLNLASLGAAINRCKAFVANDSGPMHMARALGIPTLAIFGSTDPGQFEFGQHRVMFAGVPCSPCHFYGRARCPRGHFACMHELDVDSAWGHLEVLTTMERQAPVRA